MSAAPLGWHWMGVATGCDTPALSDAEALRHLLRMAVRQLDLRSVSPPTAVPTATGLAGVVLLAESHLAIHTVEAERAAWVDLFSCVPVDNAATSRVMRDLLGASRLREQVVERRP